MAEQEAHPENWLNKTSLKKWVRIETGERSKWNLLHFERGVWHKKKATFTDILLLQGLYADTLMSFEEFFQMFSEFGEAYARVMILSEIKGI